ncbi:Protein of unknown function [Pyronema omphalodes CBS 100304]|uniref:Uncharacterized protein n=1 Tax=Pyronema omphalodes (strain CBS 100304) TaxID=1076935 RepID=U4LD26_PYROM|nr:Protein of unknown function [Pyronema omphalodes CBS 100304]
MKFALALTLLTSASAVVANAVPMMNAMFKLKVSDMGPKEIAGKMLTYSMGNGMLGIHMGMEEFTGYMGPKGMIKGPIMSMKMPMNKLFLRPTNGKPEFAARFGDPMMDMMPMRTMWKDWTVCYKTMKMMKMWFLDYNPKTNMEGAMRKNWVACGNMKEGYNIFMGKMKPGCTMPFQIEVVWQMM